ncbi:glycosyltransferase family protein [Numidum massiliense]|uniref:glycosyltransferase family protein n=1 Tax=Numidum massiliense TaxID=1522315 RepID=UPI000938E665|nr:glycosyltransferase family protein [Numidum massiliense]
MNERKVLFVTCVNDEAMYAACVSHISRLVVPDQYIVDLLPIRGASSMAAGYNLALRHEAKYKIYLHQDTFIVHPNFLEDVLSLFQAHPSLGMLGMIGCQVAPPHGTWWNGTDLVGKVIWYVNQTYLLLTHGVISEPFAAVQSVDGLLLATQYDIPWREDLFKGFHFYDASQCREFLRHGFVVGVPRQNEPWCLHVSKDGYSLDTQAYDAYRQVYIAHYGGGS